MKTIALLILLALADFSYQQYTVQLTVDPPTAGFSEIVTYEITINSNGDSQTTGLTLTNIIDLDMTIETEIVVNGMTAVPNTYLGTNTLILDITMLSPTATVSFEAQTPVAPPSNTVLYSRAELSGLNAITYPPQGEVYSDDPSTPDPDATILIIRIDFGDAPFQSSIRQGPAYHLLSDEIRISLGSLPDNELNGYSSRFATGDDINGVADEDGVILTSSLTPGTTNMVNFIIDGEDGVLDVWIDVLGADRSFDVEDYLYTSNVVATGSPQQIPIDVPAGAREGVSFLRARVHNSVSGNSDSPPFSPVGEMKTGEVEDHLVVIGCQDVGSCFCVLPFWRHFVVDIEDPELVPTLVMYKPYVFTIRERTENYSPRTESEVRYHLLHGNGTFIRELGNRTYEESMTFEFILHHVSPREWYSVAAYGSENNCFLGKVDFHLRLATHQRNVDVWEQLEQASAAIRSAPSGFEGNYGHLNDEEYYRYYFNED